MHTNKDNKAMVGFASATGAFYPYDSNSSLDQIASNTLNTLYGFLNFQVKKESMSREIRQSKKSKKKLKGKFIEIRYEVPNYEIIINPFKKNKKGYKASFKRFHNKYLKTKQLKVLKNGFVIFTPKIFC